MRPAPTPAQIAEAIEVNRRQRAVVDLYQRRHALAAQVAQMLRLQARYPGAGVGALEEKLALLADDGITAFCQLGDMLRFDPDRHEIVDGTLGPTRQVSVLEPGFSRPDQVIYHALVFATGL